MDNMREKEVLVIIPAYNEAANIGKVLDQLERPEISEIADVLVMNDASVDSTNWLVKARGHAVVTHVFNLGYGSGIQLGYKYAVRRDYKYVIQMDADGQHDVCNIPVIYDRLRQKDEDGRYPDIVLGSRFMNGSADFSISIAKKIAFHLFRFMIEVAAGRKIADPTTGLQGLSRKAVLYYSKYNHFDDKYPDTNMIMQMILLKFKVVEVPAVMHPRTAGASMHSGLKPIWYMLRMFFSVLAVVFRCKVLKVDENAGLQDVEIPYTQQKTAELKKQN
ncbi:MAG: glycosyltransferase family 2 protein [Lachnospiraceae bacterium]|jgi:glycosyltransferase involved in cell wall biosynthesis